MMLKFDCCLNICILFVMSVLTSSWGNNGQRRYWHPQPIQILCFSVSGTFKLKKTDYKKAGFDPSKTPDHMFYLDARKGTYLPIDQQVYQDVCSGKIRLWTNKIRVWASKIRVWTEEMTLCRKIDVKEIKSSDTNMEKNSKESANAES